MTALLETSHLCVCLHTFNRLLGGEMNLWIILTSKDYGRLALPRGCLSFCVRPRNLIVCARHLHDNPGWADIILIGGLRRKKVIGILLRIVLSCLQ
jgi:hypothetical protein